MDRFDLEIISCKNCKRLIEYANDVKENGDEVIVLLDGITKPVPKNKVKFLVYPAFDSAV